jgi:hypothetical protein
VWEDHLLPRLTCKDAARLGCTCKVLRGLVPQCFRDLGEVKLENMQAVLTTFLRARSMRLCRGAWANSLGPWERRLLGDEEKRELSVRLCEEGPGGARATLITVSADHHQIEEFVHAALWQGRLPSLKSVTADLSVAAHRVMGGYLESMQRLLLKVDCDRNQNA